ncbi:MAG TPA: signal peptidase II [Actinomycetes bacterium]|jgi:signal peptidase II|nr:signal peptidase II [Actinomycetes bacterium]
MTRPVARQLILYGIAAVVVAADQLTKYLVVHNLAGRPPVRLIGGVVELRYATNPGGAFSLLTGAPVFFALTALAVIAGILYAGRRARGLSVQLALGLLLGGAVGNLLDRLLRGEAPLHGEVVDFIKVGWWPVFNLADSCIVIGGLLLAFLLSRTEPPPAPRDGPGRDSGRQAGSRPTVTPRD